MARPIVPSNARIRPTASRMIPMVLVDLRRRLPRRRGTAIGVIELAVAAGGDVDRLLDRGLRDHAIRPLVARGEALIAAGFGLVHGLAFASLSRNLGFDGRSLVTTLFGFNLGIELIQPSSSCC